MAATFVAATSFIATSFAASEAHAEDTVDDSADPIPSSPTGPHVWSIGTEAYVGGYGASQASGAGMPLVGVGVLGHYGWFEGGALVEGGSQVLGGSMSGYAALAGVGYDLSPRLRISLLGELARHDYKDMGAVFLEHRGIDGNFGYGGGRLGLVYGWGHEIRFTLGGWFFVRDDFGRKTETIDYTSFLGTQTQSWTGTVGQVQSGFAVRFGMEFGGF